PAQQIGRSGHDFSHLFITPNVTTGTRNSARIPFSQFVGHSGDFLLVARADAYLPPAVSQRPRNGQPNALGPAGYKCTLSLQVSHCFTSLSLCVRRPIFY